MNYPAERLLSPSLAQRLASPDRLDQAFAESVIPEPDLTVSQWADGNRVLTSESSARPGRWRTDRVPFMREIMDMQSPQHPCTESSLCKATQIAGSESMYNVIGFAIEHAPSPIMLLMPTLDLAKLTSTQRIRPLFEETESIRGRVRHARSRDSGSTILLKKFRGGLLRIGGANSAPSLRSMPVRFLLEDEVDAYPADVGGEGDPCRVVEKRTDTFGRRKKIFRASTPKDKESSRIERYFEAGTRGRYHVPCPHCGHEQPLEWSGMRWSMRARVELVCTDCGAITPAGADKCCASCGSDQVKRRESPTDELERAWYECARCEAEIEERHKPRMLERGRHVHEVPGPGRFLDDDDAHPHAIWVQVGERIRRFLPTYERPVSWRVNALYSPLGWFSWRQAVQLHLEAERGEIDADSGEPLAKVFANTVLGMASESKGEQPEHKLLELRAEPYELGTVPDGGLLLTAFVDVQGDRLEYKCKAYGEGDESWLVDYQVIEGDPTDDSEGGVWDQLIALRRRAYTHASGATLRIAAMGVDSGYLTQTVYNFCRRWAHFHVIATKGDNQAGRPALGRAREDREGRDLSADRRGRDQRADLSAPAPGKARAAVPAFSARLAERVLRAARRRENGAQGDAPRRGARMDQDARAQ
jgi:phage terminase large subunit GpA-like protein